MDQKPPESSNLSLVFLERQEGALLEKLAQAKAREAQAREAELTAQTLLETHRRETDPEREELVGKQVWFRQLREVAEQEVEALTAELQQLRDRQADIASRASDPKIQPE